MGEVVSGVREGGAIRIIRVMEYVAGIGRLEVGGCVGRFVGGPVRRNGGRFASAGL